MYPNVTASILQEHTRALHRRKSQHEVLDCQAKWRAGRVDGHDGVGHLGARLRLLPNFAASQEVDALIVGNPEQPGRQRTRIVKGVQLSIGDEQCLLDDIFAVHYRAGHARAVPMQARPEVADGFEKRQVAGLKGAGGTWVVGTVHIDIYAAGGSWDTDSLWRDAIPRGRAGAASGRDRVIEVNRDDWLLTQGTRWPESSQIR